MPFGLAAVALEVPAVGGLLGGACALLVGMLGVAFENNERLEARVKQLEGLRISPQKSEA